MQRILVTGGAGFLGRHLCARLLERGAHVVCADNFSTGSRENILEFLGHPFFETVRHDVCQPLYVEVDAIFNLACPASPVHYQRDPVQTLKTSVLGTTNLLGLAKRLGVPLFHSSTSEVYGDPLCHPQTEDYWGNVNPNGIRACYDEGKRCAETLCFDYHRQHGVPIKVARIFNTYGPYMQAHDGRVVSNFIVQALHNDPITVYGDGTQTRSFCYVDDLVDGFLRLMDAAPALTGPVNLGNPGEYNMLELAERVKAITGSHSRIVLKPLPGDDPKKRRPDITQAREQLGWEPTVALDEGLKRTVAYFEQRFAAGMSAGALKFPAVRPHPVPRVPQQPGINNGCRAVDPFR